jgi:hypothetical protein
MSVFLSWHPLLLSRSPLLLPLYVLWGVYLSLAFVILAYVNLYLPGTPVAVDEGFIYVGIVGIGCCVLVPTELIPLGLPVEDRRVVVACIAVLIALIAGLIVFWEWLIRKYGGANTSYNGMNLYYFSVLYNDLCRGFEIFLFRICKFLLFISRKHFSLNR